MFRRKKRCLNLDPSPHPAYSGRRCIREAGHDGLCRTKVGAYYHYWLQKTYERLGQARRKENP